MLNVLIGLVASTLTLAATSGRADETAQRAQLRQERDALVRAHANEQRECKTRFVVTACLDDAAARQRERLEALRQREFVLADADRQRRASERQRDIGAKKVPASRSAAWPASVVVPAQAEALASTPASVSAPAPAPASVPTPRLQPHAEQAQARVRAAQQRQAKVAEVQARVARREAARQAGAHPAQGLPVPSAPPQQPSKNAVGAAGAAGAASAARR